MDRITCDIIRDLLPLYIDEVCSAGSRALVEGHLQNCPACKAEYETISKREFFYDARERKVLDRLSKRWKQSRRKMLFVGAAAALLAALLIGLIAFGCSMKVIPAEEIAVSSLSRLGNGDLAFILQSADGKTGLRELSYYEMDGKLLSHRYHNPLSTFFSIRECAKWLDRSYKGYRHSADCLSRARGAIACLGCECAGGAC